MPARPPFASDRQAIISKDLLSPMSRVIRVETAHRARQRVLQGMSLALRRAASPSLDLSEQRDLLAFLDLSLVELGRSIDETSAAWEKRGYWLKADRFRQDWEWTERLGRNLSSALASDNLEAATGTGIELATHLRHVRIPAALSAARPWQGAWDKHNGAAKDS